MHEENISSISSEPYPGIESGQFRNFHPLFTIFIANRKEIEIESHERKNIFATRRGIWWRRGKPCSKLKGRCEADSRPCNTRSRGVALNTNDIKWTLRIKSANVILNNVEYSPLLLVSKKHRDTWIFITILPDRKQPHSYILSRENFHTILINSYNIYIYKSRFH